MRIGEVAQRSGVSARMLRHYDALGLVTPGARTGSGYREYTAADVTRIFHVESLRSLGLSLREVGQALDDPTFAPAELVAALKKRSAERIRAEQGLLARLEHIDESGPDDWEQVLGIVAQLSALASATPDHRQRAALIVDDRQSPVAALVDSLLNEADLNVAGALRWAVARSGTGAVVPLVAAAADRDVVRRRRAVAALIDIPGDEATTALRAAVVDPDVEIRAGAVLELADRVDDVPPEALVSLIVDGVRDVDAADALAALARRTAAGDQIAEPLVRALVDAPAGVRCRVAQALGEIPGAIAHDALLHLRDDDDQMVASTAAYLVGLRQ
ncbi:MerR family transcriptional regulator [Gordonia sp. (in: high G+C Gram-positive bacteria)]|uniref:MerR family transcriptional regulator n=1 Tax=Gordonia sp. (in: high G+C Gram-positive bacteria) TaxID=84139 RepID=UPI0016ACC84D|nr:MerR family transcriptional regulator [Gordonia sp. (in: high G+C Gram-positive bacteria)]NLG45231.1 MerR family transcriptional regulator [Gordonia sp. (in: high G+C Gram-positive bacteria)]